MRVNIPKISSAFALIFSMLLFWPMLAENGELYGQNGEPKLSNDRVSSPSGCSDGWDTTFTPNGVDGQVQVVTSDAAGNVYIGGTFTSVNGVPASGVAKWDGVSWSGLGTGVGTFGTVKAIAVSGNDVYVGGSFGSAGGVLAKNVAKWNGSSWSALGAGLGGGTHVVEGVTVIGSDVYIGGNFNIADGSPAEGVVRWDGSAYSTVGPGILGQVVAVESSGGNLYVGGNIATATTPGSSIGILKWDGTSWSTLGLAANSSVNTIVFSGSDLYAVGVIRVGTNSSTVAKYNGTSWTGMQTFSGIVTSAAVVGSDLYVGGELPSSTFNNIARWTGSAWVGVSGGVTGDSGNSPRINGMAAVGNSLVVGGAFTTAGTAGARNVAKLSNGTTWSGFDGTGIDAPANAIAVSGTDVYVGGTFGTAGPITANKIAKWNSVTNTWSTLGTGLVAGNISAIAVAGGRVYAGGTFSAIGGISANNIAVWNGTSWSALGTGLNSSVGVIIVRGEDVYAGGSFSTAGGVTANRVAKWNGTSWTGLNSGHIPTTVSGMAFMGNDLYVSTGTTTVANPAYFSKYDGTSWTLLGGDLGDRGVASIAVVGTDVYVAGGFDSINGVTVNRIAKFNGTSWSPLGNGLPPASQFFGGARLATSGTDLVATGDFAVAMGGPANRIARWNGTAWTGLGTGLNVAANSIAAAGGDIFVGGQFTTAGCNASPYFARWRQTAWTASTNTDWHTPSNWGSSSIPTTGDGVTISASNAVISTANVSVGSLIVTAGRTVTIAAGRTLTVTGTLDVTNGTVDGPGTLIVNDLSLNNGNVVGLSGITINGSLYLNGGAILGSGAVAVISCRSSAIAGGNSISFIASPLTRCVNSAGTYRFPVGSSSVYAPVELSAISGSGNFTVEPKTGAYAGAASGLPENRLQRWWNTTNGGITQADLNFSYIDAEVSGIEGRYRAYRIDAGTAQLIPTVLNYTTNKATVAGATSFAAWTLAEGPATFEMLNGRITTPMNRGAERVIVSLTDQLGNVRYAFTNGFGYYRFMNVETFKNYTVRLQSKRHTFAQPERTLEFVENAPPVNFVSTNH